MKKQSIVDFNIDVFQKSLEEAFNAEAEARWAELKLYQDPNFLWIVYILLGCFVW